MLEIVADPVPLSMDAQGVVTVAGTRVTLDTIIACYLNGDAPQEIADAFPTVSLADIHAVIAYYLRHRAAVEAYLAANTQTIARLRKEVEAVQGVQPSRQTLQTRRNNRRADADLSS